MTSTHKFGSAQKNLRAFTLVELLVVISIMALLAALIFPVVRVVNRTKIRSKARVELEQVATAIESYKAKLGHYPPDNPNPLYRFINPLYYELLGTTNNIVSNAGLYGTLDRSSSIQASDVLTAFGIGGFVNTMRAGAEEGQVARNFLSGLKPNQIGELPAPAGARVIVSSVQRLNADFQLKNSSGTTLGIMNPFFYNSSAPTNNPNSYDLYLDVLVDGKTNRISNWSKEPLVLSGPE